MDEWDQFSDFEPVGASAAATEPPPLSFTAKATGYFPVAPTDPRYQMEGGNVGAGEWHGQSQKPEPLYTLDQYRRGEAPYVSVAMDNSPSNPLDYGAMLQSPQFPNVSFRVMDTGSAFNGRSSKYGGPKGLGRIDIARDNNSGANHPENNRQISFSVAPSGNKAGSDPWATFADAPELSSASEDPSTNTGDKGTGDAFANFADAPGSTSQAPASPSVDPWNQFADAAPSEPAQGFGDLKAAEQQQSVPDKWTPPAAIQNDLRFTNKPPSIEGLQESVNTPYFNIPKPDNTGVGTGIARGAIGMVEGLESPQNASIAIGSAFVPPIAQKLIAAGFGAQMMHAAPDEIDAARNAATPGEAAEHWTRAALSFLGGGLIAGHGASGRPTEGGGAGPSERPATVPLDAEGNGIYTPAEAPRLALPAGELAPPLPPTTLKPDAGRERETALRAAIDRDATATPEEKAAAHARVDDLTRQRLAAQEPIPPAEPVTVAPQPTKKPSLIPERTVSPNDLPDAEGAANTKWYHGTGAEIPNSDAVSSSFSNIESLFGSGVYLTDSPQIAASYGAKRGGVGSKVYEMQVSPRNVLNFDKPIPPDAIAAIRASAYDELKPEIDKFVAANPGANGSALWRRLSDAVREHADENGWPKSEYAEMFQGIEDSLRGAGYDAITHVGGLRTGTGTRQHKVLILLDPRSEYAAKELVQPPTVRSVQKYEPPPIPEPAPAASVEPISPLEPSPAAPSAPENVTSIKNAATDIDRAAMALMPREIPETQPLSDAKAEAAQIWQEKPGEADRLAASLEDGSRRVTPTESVLLAMKKTEGQRAIDAQVESILRAQKEGDTAGAERLGKQLEEMDAKQQEYLNLLNKIGTAWGREGRARQEFQAQDWSVEGIVRQRLARNGGQPIGPEEMAGIREVVAKAKAADEAANARETQIEQQKAEEAAQEASTPAAKDALAKLVVEMQEARKPKPDAGKAAQIVSYLEGKVEEARARLKRKQEGESLLSGPGDITDIDDYAIIAAYHIAKAGLKGARLAKALVDEFGEAIKPHLAAIYAEAKRKIADGRRAALTNEDIVAQRKKYVVKRIAELKRLIATGKSGRRAPLAYTPDPELIRLRAEAEAIKTRYLRGVEAKRRATQPRAHRFLEGVAKWSRASVLSGPSTIAKLTSTAAQTGAVFSPIESILARGIGYALPKIAAKAPRYGKPLLVGELAAIKSLRYLWRDFTGQAANPKGMKERVTGIGTADFDLIHGKPHLAPPEWKEVFGAFHKALKTPVRRNEFERSMVNRLAHAARSGEDITSPAVQTRVGADAYLDAQKSIFMEDNALVDMFKRAMSRLKKADPQTGRPTLVNKAAESLINSELPVVRIPTNIVKRAFEYGLGTISGGYRLAGALAKGIDQLKPEQADAIIRNFARGSIGAGLIALGYFQRENAGGYYRRDDRKHSGEPDFGEAKLFGQRIPKLLMHHPAIEAVNIGATIGQVFDKKAPREGDAAALGEGVFEGVKGLAEEAPFLGTTIRDVEALREGPRKFVGEHLQSKIPQAVQQAARYSDMKPGPRSISDYISPKAVKRSPKSVGDYLRMGVPGLRKKVPESARQ